MQFLDGKKTWLGAVVALGGVVVRVVTESPECQASLAAGLAANGGELAIGAGVLLSSLGLIHKREKRREDQRTAEMVARIVKEDRNTP